MDFSDIGRKSRDEAGTWMHLEVDGKKLYWDGKDVILPDEEPKDAKPCRIKIRGMLESGVIKIHRAIEVANKSHAIKVSRAKLTEVDDIVAAHLDLMRTFDDKLAIAAVCEFENIHYGGEPAPLDDFHVKAIFGANSPFIGAIALKTFADVGFSKPAAKG